MPAIPTVCAGLLDGSDGIDADLLLAGICAHEKVCYRRLIRRPKKAWQYLRSRWLLRAHLGFELGLSPLDVPIRQPVNSPPAVAGYDYQLALSHSGVRCLCLSSTQALAVGCDIEHDRSHRRVQAIAGHYFHPDEARCLAQQDDRRARRDFHRLWVLKEATQKARRLGLAGGLRSPAFELRPRLRCIDAPLAQARWTFAAHTDIDYSFALVVDAAVAPQRFLLYRYIPTTQGPVRYCVEFCPDIATVGAGSYE